MTEYLSSHNCPAKSRQIVDDAEFKQFVDTSKWRSMLAGTFTIKQAQRFTVPPSTMETYLAADEHQCKKAFEYFMHLLNSKIYKNAYSRYNKSLRVIDVLGGSIWTQHIGGLSNGRYGNFNGRYGN